MKRSAPITRTVPLIRHDFAVPPSPRGRLTGDRKGRPYKEAGTLPRRAGENARPYGGKQTRSVGWVKPGADPELYQEQILQTQGPVARREFRPTTQILRAGRAAQCPRGNPRNGGPGGVSLRQGRRSRACLSAQTPWRLFGDFLAVPIYNASATGDKESDSKRKSP